MRAQLKDRNIGSIYGIALIIDSIPPYVIQTLSIMLAILHIVMLALCMFNVLLSYHAQNYAGIIGSSLRYS